MKLIIHTDGGARGNPGPAAVGVVIEKENNAGSLRPKIIKEISKAIGESTNNFAEYSAVIEALKSVKNQVSGIKQEKFDINFYLDSTLVVNQLNGIFKVKEPTLRNLLMQVRVLEQEVGGIISYEYVPREENRQADFLVNQALDSLLMSS